MTSSSAERPLRTRLREALVAAMRRRDAAAVSALRSTLAAIDNAEAVDPSHAPSATSGAIAGAVGGLGAAEVPRVQLSEHEVAALVRAAIDERHDAAAQYERLGQSDRVARLRDEAAALAEHIDSVRD
jgi:uncharacterized protein YqeY